MKQYKNYIVLDFEATCDDLQPPDPQEIIEFPSVLLSADFEPIDEFESFVRPTALPTLSAFCKDLTGIKQSEVDAADPFSVVFERHLAWLEGNDLPLTPTHGEPLPYLFITCGDWDFQTMFPAQFRSVGIDFVPHPYRNWMNIKKPFEKWHGKKARGMVGMLEALDLKLEGRHHRGIDDCRNIAKIARSLYERGQRMEATSKLAASRYPEITLEVRWGERVEPIILTKRVLPTLLGAAAEVFRAQASLARTLDGKPLTDVMLKDFKNGDSITVE